MAKRRKRSAKKKAGMPPFEPTSEQRNTVEIMAGFAIPHNDIRRVVKNPTSGKPIDAKTLRLHFRDELDNGRAVVQGLVAGMLLKGARAERGVAERIFLGKTVLGLRETNRTVVAGDGNEPLKIVVKGGLPE